MDHKVLSYAPKNRDDLIQTGFDSKLLSIPPIWVRKSTLDAGFVYFYLQFTLGFSPRVCCVPDLCSHQNLCSPQNLSYLVSESSWS